VKLRALIEKGRGMGELAGVRIIVTGAASGIGAACWAAYARAGARTVGMDIDAEGGARLAASLGGEGGQARFIACDVARRGEVDEAFAAAGAWLGGLDVLAHIAGMVALTPASEITEEEMRQVMDVNFMGTFHTNQAAWRLMESGGRIINTGSMAGMRPLAGYGHYGASKAALMAWTRIAAAEWGARGISVNAIAPTAMTPMALRTLDHLPEAERAARLQAMMQNANPLGRLAPPEEGVAPLMVFLATPGAAYITGQTISVDGGSVMLGA
jgi:NAD(P)-dependent dehydrogenase (short-subunit alcohol dehydrogenase family)